MQIQITIQPLEAKLECGLMHAFKFNQNYFLLNLILSKNKVHYKSTNNKLKFNLNDTVNGTENFLNFAMFQIRKS